MCVLVAVFVWIASEGRQLDVSSRDYVGRVLDTTLRHWDRSAIRAEASRRGYDLSPVSGREPRRASVLRQVCGAPGRGVPILRVLERAGRGLLRGCAAPLTVASRPDEARFASPQSYTPQHLAEKILTSRSALEGERKQVTVLFADLKGSMELLADRDPEEARKLLDPVLEHMMEAVHRYEGTVNQVMGDGIMALVGAPIAPRGPRGSRLLRGAAHAGRGETVR